MTDIKQIPNKETDDMIAALEAFKRSTPSLIEYNLILVKMRRDAYLAYKKAGFTDKESLELCKDAGKF